MPFKIPVRCFRIADGQLAFLPSFREKGQKLGITARGMVMFEITEYRHPYILVRCRRSFETYRFLIADDGTLEHEGARFDLGDARRTAIAYLEEISHSHAA